VKCPPRVPCAGYGIVTLNEAGPISASHHALICEEGEVPLEPMLPPKQDDLT
jgi:hypothetical protein